MAKETKKQKWQRIAKEQKIKFQDNDTISMLTTSIAYKLGLDPVKLTGAKLEKAIDDALAKPAPKKAAAKKAPAKKSTAKKATPKKADTKKDTTKKAEPKKASAKKTPAKKSSTKKDVKITPPSDLKADKPKVKIPAFKDMAEMKNFCVSVGLNRVDGYILESKKKKADFLKWIKKNIDKASPAPTGKTENPHSPSAGIGEMKTGSNIDKAKATATPVAPTPTQPSAKKKSRVQETEKFATPPLSTGEVSNELPNALSENKKMLDGYVEEGETQEAPKADYKGEMLNYGISIVHHLKIAPMFRINGGISRGELELVLKGAKKDYNYEVVNDKNGTYLNLTDHEGNSCRIPSEGYLPMV